MIGRIDRSERVDYAYRYVDGELERYPVQWDVPGWDPDGHGSHSVAIRVEAWRPVVESGGRLIGAFEDDEPVGLAIGVAEFEPGMAWLAFMHVTRAHRRSGIGKALWAEAVQCAIAGGSKSIYVSATPSGPTVDFYMGLGCRLVDDPHPELYDMEPDDIHLVCEL